MGDFDSWAQRRGVPSPYLQLTLPADPTLKNNIASLCLQCGLPTYDAKKDSLPQQMVALMMARKIRILFIDEFNHLLVVNRVEARKNLIFFKLLSGPPMSLILVGFGTHESMNAINMDPQTSSRFQIFELQQWGADEEFRSFLASYEKYLPLRFPSNLASKDIVNFFASMVEPTTRNVINRIKFAAMNAILDGSERIDVDILKHSVHIPDLSSIYEC